MPCLIANTLKTPSCSNHRTTHGPGRTCRRVTEGANRTDVRHQPHTPARVVNAEEATRPTVLAPCPSPSPDFETPLVASVRFTSLSIAGCQNLHPAGYGLTLRVNYNRTDLNVSSSTRRPSTSPSTDLAVAARRPTDFGLFRRCRVPSSSSADFADVPRYRPGLQPFRLCSTTRLHRRRTRASCRLVT